MEETIVISLGGSLIVPEEIDKDFLKDFKNLIISFVKNGKKFVIITGGGKIARKYQDAAKEISNVSNTDLDWIGIASLRLNAELLRAIFGDFTHSEIILDMASSLASDKPIVIGGAVRPGSSTDLGAVRAAKTVGAKRVINLSNIDYAYDSDPRTNPEAKPIKSISWAEYRKLIPAEWNPGLSTPFDPIASKMAEEENMEVAILNGKNIPNLQKCLNGEEFIGTKIK
jgi:uridylate kinase